MSLTPTPQKAFDIVVVDTIGPLTKSNDGNIYAVTLMCDLTKYLVTVPIPDKTARSVAKAIFENFVLIFGPMKQLKSDRGTEYENQILSEICNLMKTEQKIATAYHHQSVGTVERNHRVFNEYLRSFVIDMANWDEYLKYFSFLYTSTKIQVSMTSIRHTNSYLATKLKFLILLTTVWSHFITSTATPKKLNIDCRLHTIGQLNF